VWKLNEGKDDKGKKYDAKEVKGGTDVAEKRDLKLIVGYDRNRNEYSLVKHNQTSEEAQSFLDQWTQHVREGHSFIVLGQARPHRTEQVEDCKACRETVARSAHLEPQPKFKRRSE
jgi:hypothetical protein